MYYFCTYFDQNYLSRALVMIDSLKKHCPPFKIFVLCLDQYTFDYLKNEEKETVVPISLETLEGKDKELNNCKPNRSRVEYFFTLSPCLPLYIFQNFPDLDHITYLDSDLFFFSSPEAIYEELGNKSVYIIPHRFPSEHQSMAAHGVYNVGFQIFRNDQTGIACLKRWREQCIEWCYDKLEDNRFADQKYLDEWPDLYKDKIVVSENTGANLAPWNVAGVKFEKTGNKVKVDGKDLIFYHFHGLRFIKSRLVKHGMEIYFVESNNILKDHIYAPYIGALIRKNKILKRKNDKTERINKTYTFKELNFFLKKGYTFFYINDQKCLNIKLSRR
jgi:hypothetical protein